MKTTITNPASNMKPLEVIVKQKDNGNYLARMEIPPASFHTFELSNNMVLEVEQV